MGDNAGAALGLGAQDRRRRRLARNKRHRLRRDRPPGARCERHRRRIRGCRGRLPPARRHAQRGQEPGCDRDPARGRPRRARAPRPHCRTGIGRPRTRTLVRGRTDTEPTGCHGTPHRHDARVHNPSKFGPRCHRGHAVRSRRRTRRRAGPGGRDHAHPADRRRCAEPGGHGDRRPGIRPPGRGAVPGRVCRDWRDGAGRLGAHPAPPGLALGAVGRAETRHASRDSRAVRRAAAESPGALAPTARYPSTPGIVRVAASCAYQEALSLGSRSRVS